VHVLATHLYEMIATGFATDYGKAAAVGMSVLATSVTLIVVYRALTSESEKYVTISSRGYRPTVVELGRRESSALRRGGAPLLHPDRAAGGGPALHLAGALLDGAERAGVFDDEPAALDRRAQRPALAARAEEQPVPRGGRGHAGRVLSVFVAYVIVKVKSRASGVLESLSYLSFSFPGIVIGVGFMWFFVQTPLYATIWALLIGYIATYLPYGIRPLSSAFVQIHSHLEESSLVCGASPMTTMRRIIVPLLIPGIVSAGS
jgi:iron(III) transport system permease protein